MRPSTPTREKKIPIPIIKATKKGGLTLKYPKKRARKPKPLNPKGYGTIAGLVKAVKAQWAHAQAPAEEPLSVQLEHFRNHLNLTAACVAAYGHGDILRAQDNGYPDPISLQDIITHIKAAELMCEPGNNGVFTLERGDGVWKGVIYVPGMPPWTLYL